MKVILQKDVPNLGDAGEIKRVAAGYARNYLIPKNLVILAQEGSNQALEHQKKLIAIKAERRIKDMQAVSESLKALGRVEVEARVGANGKMFGSVTAITIAQALAAKDFFIDKRKIELSEKIKTVGTFTVKIRLAEKLIAPLEVDVKAVEAVEEEVEDEFADEAKANEAALLRQKEREESRASEQPQDDASESADSEGVDAEASSESDSSESEDIEVKPESDEGTETTESTETENG